MFLEALEPRQLLNADNNPPVGVNDSYSLLENDTLSITSPGVLSNDNDPENSALTAIHYSGPGYGTLTLNIDGSFVYTPNSGYVGSDSFTYQAYDGSLASGLITVSLTVDEVPPPTVVDAIDDAFATDEDTALWVSDVGQAPRLPNRCLDCAQTECKLKSLGGSSKITVLVARPW